MPEERRRFSTFSDWYDFLGEVKEQEEGVNLYEYRQACYKEIEGLRERPLLVYAAMFPGAPNGAPTAIDFHDVDGFTDLIESVDEDTAAVDVLLHSAGGAPEATERIVSLLRARFDDVQFLIPHSAYSAATMLALSGNEIILHPSASLGPIDPQIDGIPARSIRRGFEKVRDRLKKEGPEELPAYVPLLEKHTLERLEICEDSEKLAKELATEWLGLYMFDEENGEDTSEKIEKIVDFLSDYDEHKTHGRALTYERLEPYDLEMTKADGALKGLLREAHILLAGFFSVTQFIKLYEVSDGLSWGRRYQQAVSGSESGGEDEG